MVAWVEMILLGADPAFGGGGSHPPGDSHVAFFENLEQLSNSESNSVTSPWVWKIQPLESWVHAW